MFHGSDSIVLWNLASQAAGQAVAQRIGDYASAQEKATGDPEWAEGGNKRAAMQAAGAAVVAGLGGGVASAVEGAAGAAIGSKMGGNLNKLSDSIAASNPTGDANVNQALGNIVANVIATGAGAAAGGAGAFSSSDVDRYNRQLHSEEKTLAKQLADKSGGKYTQAQIEDQMRIMGVSDNGTNESGAPTTLIGQAPTDAGAKWISGGTTANGQPILTQVTAQADPALQSYILSNYNSASANQVPSQFTYQQTGSGSTNITGPFTRFDQSDANYVRNTTSDATSMISTNAGRISSLAAAGGAITPCSVVCDGIAYAGTVIGIAADAVGQLAKPNAGQYIVNGINGVLANFSSSAAPAFSPFINELTNQVNESGITTSSQDALNATIDTKNTSGKK
ncbi:hemolysin [Paraburkholderia hiiakae]|uniref:hemolysin n=1 Tax=Paraburkholderia hiiakae TaxID=1081782 RepID=UPI001919FAFF|nr:hemolysin [Paraburkholderia hiiakae]